ncbi:MAG: sensor histidine kinase, partial [Anaerotignaceae bacterium]
KYDYLDLMISDFNKMVEELGSIETLKTDFFSNVSHEIKTPIAVIQNNAELLQKESISIEQRKECTDNIIYATRRLSSLISNMLKLNKLEKQSILPNLEYYDLPSQLCECALQFEEQWEKKNIEFDVDIEEEALIFADKELMEIVWTNLLSNALKFSDENGKITLKQFSKNNEVVVSIKDSGCGMDTKTLNRIFDKFYQGDTSRSTLGNGLGLALTKRILEMLNCSIYVESEINVGSEFIVTFHGEVETL